MQPGKWSAVPYRERHATSIRNLEDRWLTPRLTKMELDEEGMGWHSFKRFRKTWLRGARCLEDLNNFWMAHKPHTMSEVYSHLHEELQLRLDEATRVGYGFALPASNTVAVVPNVPKLHQNSAVEIAAKMIERAGIKLVDVTGIEPVIPCLQSKQKFKLSRCFGCAYQFEVVLRLLQRCSKNAEKENTPRTGEYRQ